MRIKHKYAGGLKALVNWGSVINDTHSRVNVHSALFGPKQILGSIRSNLGNKNL